MKTTLIHNPTNDSSRDCVMPAYAIVLSLVEALVWHDEVMKVALGEENVSCPYATLNAVRVTLTNV